MKLIHYLHNKVVGTDSAEKSESCQTPCAEQFPSLGEIGLNGQLVEHCLHYQPKELMDSVKVFDFQYPVNTDEEMFTLIDFLLHSCEIYSQI